MKMKGFERYRFPFIFNKRRWINTQNLFFLYEWRIQLHFLCAVERERVDLQKLQAWVVRKQYGRL